MMFEYDTIQRDLFKEYYKMFKAKGGEDKTVHETSIYRSRFKTSEKANTTNGRRYDRCKQPSWPSSLPSVIFLQRSLVDIIMDWTDSHGS